ncbi:MAG: cobalt-precorrin-6A reductase [Kiloniellales bacterium]
MNSQPSRKIVLLLGGTAEAAELAERLAGRSDLEVIISLAGRTQAPGHLPGKQHRGGFGGAEGLAEYLRAESIGLLLDATHPFAAQISENAAGACAETGVPRLLLLRPPWTPRQGDRWIEVSGEAAAAAALPGLARRVFLSIGRQELAAFSGLPDIWFLVRSIEPPEGSVPLKSHEMILARGPFTVEEEVLLLQKHEVGALVSKNSGGAATYAKVEAARRLGLPVVMIGRPPAPEGETAASVEQALAWVEARCPVRATPP